MNSAQRIDLIKERLQHAFSPMHLELIDDSEKHRGHVGNQGGAGHYTLKISAACFQNMARLEAHRKIYAVLSDLIPNEIHALQIKVF